MANKLILIAILIVLCFSGQAWGASITCYVRTTGSNTSPYETEAKGATTLKACVDYIRTNGDGSSANLIDIGAGQFSSSSDYASLENANLINLTIRGVGRGVTILNPSGTGPFNLANCNGLIISSLTAIVPASGNHRGIYASTSGDTVTVNDVDFIGSTPYLGNLYYINNTKINSNRVRFFHEYDATDGRNAVRLVGSSSGIFDHCMSMSTGASKSAQGWSIESTGKVEIYNSLILDNQAKAIGFTSTGEYIVKNNIISGCIRNAADYPIVTGDKNVTLANNIVIANPWSAARWVSGTYTDGGGNLFTSVNPKFATMPRQGFILPRIDDVGNGTTSGWAYAETVSQILAAKGYTGTYMVNQSSTSAPCDANCQAALIRLVSGGVFEVGSHSFSHSDLTLTGKIFDVTKGAETITIDRTAGTITLSGGGSITGFKSKTLAAIKTELEGLGATVTPVAFYSTTSGTAAKLWSGALGEVIDSGTAVNVINLKTDDHGSAGTPPAGGYYKSEIYDQIAWLHSVIGSTADPQTGTTYTARSFGFPYNQSGTNPRLATIYSGYVNASSGKIGGAGNITDVPYSGDIDMYAIVDVAGSTYLQGENEAGTRYNARALAFAAAHTGLVIGILCHSTSECSANTWTYAVDEWAKFGNQLKVMSHQQFRDYIANVANGWTDDADGTYSRTYVNGVGNYQLSSGSPAINAGTVVAGVHDQPGCVDFAGMPCVRGSAPDIGAYEYQYSLGGLFQPFNIFNVFAPHRRLH